MTIQDELALSYYEEIGPFDGRKKITLVREKTSGRIFLKKERAAGEIPVYEWLQEHPAAGIPVIREVIPDGDLLHVIEEYIDGRTLSSLIEETFADREESRFVDRGAFRSVDREEFRLAGQPYKLFSALDVCRWMHQLLNLLKVLHGAQPPIIHRDLKPDNLVISKGNNLYLVDCNSARFFNGKVERDTRLLGTAGYAAPEQFGFGESDQRTDIYAFGIILNAILTGKTSRQQIADGVWRALIEKCLEIDPKNRYRNVEELEADLVRIGKTYTAESRQISDYASHDEEAYWLPGQEPNAPEEMPDIGEPAAPEYMPDIGGPAAPEDVLDIGEPAAPENRQTKLPERPIWFFPGLRIQNQTIRTGATVGYAIALLLLVLLIVTEKPKTVPGIIGNAVLLVLAFLLPVLYLGNYLGIKRFIPGSQMKNPVGRIIVQALWAVALFMICAFIAGLIKSVAGV